MEYKIFCVSCDWNTTKLSEKPLWSSLSECPNCGGYTDAIKVKSTLDE